MRVDVPSPHDLRGGTLWAEATILAPSGSSVTLPIGAGNRIWQADQWPSEQLSNVQIPRMFKGEDLLGGAVGSDGHRVSVKMFARTRARAWSWQVGTYAIDSAVADGPAISMNASLPVRLVDEHRYSVAQAVHRASTIPMIVSRLLNEDKLSAWIDPALGRPEVPVGFTIGEDRGEALQQLLTAWGAYMAATPYGDVGIYRMPTTAVEDPNLVFREDPETGTVVDAPITLDRKDIHNHVTVRVKDQTKVAEATQTFGRYAVDSYGYRTLAIESDEISRFAEAQLVARAELRKGLLRAVTIPVEAVTDYRVEPFDGARLHADAVKGIGRITGFDIPLHPDSTAVFDLGLEV